MTRVIDIRQVEETDPIWWQVIQSLKDGGPGVGESDQVWHLLS